MFYILTSFIIFASITLTGCNNENKTLARNLDDTIANLVYSVSSLDWADSTILNELNNSNDNTYTTPSLFDTTQNIDVKQLTTDNNTQRIEHQNSLTSNTINHNNYDHTKDTLKTPNINYNNTKDLNINPYTNEINHTHKYKRHKHTPYIINNANNLYSNQETTKNITNTTDNIKNNQYTKSQTLQSTTSDTPQKFMMVSYSTENIESKFSDIQSKISELINMRSNILLYINDLYKGYVDLNNESRKATNAYINIIKDNTSFLNTNRGMITNQITQAHNLATNNSYSPLINAYLIRTSETIQTRLAKIDSSIQAIESICDIISCSLNENSPNFKNINSTNGESLLNTDTFNDSIVKNSKLNENFNILEEKNNISITPYESSSLKDPIQEESQNNQQVNTESNVFNNQNLEMQDEKSLNNINETNNLVEIDKNNICDNCITNETNNSSKNNCKNYENQNIARTNDICNNCKECDTLENCLIEESITTPSNNSTQTEDSNINNNDLLPIENSDSTPCFSLCFIDKNRREKLRERETTTNNLHELNKGYIINKMLRIR